MHEINSNNSGSQPRPKGSEKPACSCCGGAARKMFRVKIRRTGPWVAVCPICVARGASNSEYFTYGGRATVRRRRGA